MRIRSITFFVHPRWPLSELLLQKAGTFARHAREAFQTAGYPVQTIRMATPPFSDFLPEVGLPEICNQVEVWAHSEGFDYLSLGPAFTGRLETYQVIPDLLASTGNTFFSGHLTTSSGEVSLSAVRACAEVIHRLGPLEPDGFANLRFAALANVPPWAPFFPAAYHQGKSPSFALALEAADLVVDAFSQAVSLAQAQKDLLDIISTHAQVMEKLSEKLSSMYGFEFKGIDFTPAPFPTKDKSLGHALESLGLAGFGLSGSLAAAAFLTSTLDHAGFKRTGFNGLMLPLLEDSVLAQRGSEGLLTVTDLLLYSAVCGTGLDTLPLPGDTSVDQLYAVLLDLAALSSRLAKPLTARLMPIPGKHAGEKTSFDFEFFANSKVLALPAKPLTGLLAGSEVLNIAPRHNQNY